MNARMYVILPLTIALTASAGLAQGGATPAAPSAPTPPSSPVRTTVSRTVVPLAEAGDASNVRVRVGKDEYVFTMKGQKIESGTRNGKALAAEEIERLTVVEGDYVRLLNDHGDTIATFSAPLNPFSNSVPMFMPPGSGGGGSVILRSPGDLLDPEEMASRRVMVGVQMVAIDSALVGHFGLEPGVGVMVSGVADGLPAAAAGLKPYDIIVAIDDKQVEHINALADALKAKKAKPGDTVKFSVVQSGAKRDVIVTVEPFDGAKFTTTKWDHVPYENRSERPRWDVPFKDLEFKSAQQIERMLKERYAMDFLWPDGAIPSGIGTDKSGQTAVNAPKPGQSPYGQTGSGGGAGGSGGGGKGGVATRPGQKTPANPSDVDVKGPIIIMNEPNAGLLEERLARLDERLVRLEAMIGRLVEMRLKEQSVPATTPGSGGKKEPEKK